LAQEGLDNLTGALRRSVGLAAIQREIDRTTRTGESLVVAFIDVDGLKRTNDTIGHAAGDELLRAVARSITHHLRSYDVITRYGGDEFVCSLSAQDVDGARARFADVSARLAEKAAGASITVGFASREENDTLEDLVHRADEAMLAVRAGSERAA
jgi:diguanylate cyclase (GGDEF)-like protein